jgi:hypothetical protein
MMHVVSEKAVTAGGYRLVKRHLEDNGWWTWMEFVHDVSKARFCVSGAQTSGSNTAVLVN